MRIPRAFHIDTPLPPPGPRRWVTIGGMAFGGLVALLVVASFVVLVIGQ
jgi:hypothetical protein